MVEEGQTSGSWLSTTRRFRVQKCANGHDTTLGYHVTNDVTLLMWYFYLIEIIFLFQTCFFIKFFWSNSNHFLIIF